MRASNARRFGRFHLRHEARGDHAHFLVLAGLVLTLAFMAMGYGIVQVRNLEATARLDPSSVSGAIADWRVTRLYLIDDVPIMIPLTLQPDQLDDGALANLSSAFNNLTSEFGHVGRVALAPDHELRSVDSNGNYDAWSVDSARHYTHAYDGTPDGVLWRSPCPTSADVAGCIVGVVLNIQEMDHDYSMSEPVLYATN